MDCFFHYSLSKKKKKKTRERICIYSEIKSPTNGLCLLKMWLMNQIGFTGQYVGASKKDKYMQMKYIPDFNL